MAGDHGNVIVINNKSTWTAKLEEAKSQGKVVKDRLDELFFNWLFLCFMCVECKVMMLMVFLDPVQGCCGLHRHLVRTMPAHGSYLYGAEQEIHRPCFPQGWCRRSACKVSTSPVPVFQSPISAKFCQGGAEPELWYFTLCHLSYINLYCLHFKLALWPREGWLWCCHFGVASSSSWSLSLCNIEIGITRLRGPRKSVFSVRAY